MQEALSLAPTTTTTGRSINSNCLPEFVRSCGGPAVAPRRRRAAVCHRAIQDGFAAHAVFFDDKQVPLTPLEHRRLLAKAWGRERGEELQPLKVLVGRIRAIPPSCYPKQPCSSRDLSLSATVARPFPAPVGDFTRSRLAMVQSAAGCGSRRWRRSAYLARRGGPSNAACAQVDERLCAGEQLPDQSS